MHNTQQLLIPSRHLFVGSNIPSYRYKPHERRVMVFNQGSLSLVMPSLNT